MELSTLEDIYFTKNQVNYQDITKLEGKFEEKYQELIKLKSGPESNEYQELKAELIGIDEEIDSLLWG
ncbi:MAG: hypothetical protein AMQ22_02249 [Candidatus Methanofastidiosum methylothiophilum]|uniref:Uncharacterized protein n=1 Tax=Candidatus Methanofastidiosum methylothiophilum TaxID=1705564 RepID=A0A150IJ34_9EURY|nr:MAG: hypothetical protein AMQ22_02249 [Candidatus Methanofastidiosum methylthiophilus]